MCPRDESCACCKLAARTSSTRQPKPQPSPSRRKNVARQDKAGQARSASQTYLKFPSCESAFVARASCASLPPTRPDAPGFPPPVDHPILPRTCHVRRRRSIPFVSTFTLKRLTLTSSRASALTALKLIVDARRSTATDTLQKYNSSLVRQVCLETRLLYDEIKRLASNAEQAGLSQNRSLIANLTVQHLSTRRNKRCLLAYHQHRLDRLQKLYWSGGGALAHVLNDADTRSKLSPHEVDFLRGYNDLVLGYKQEFIDVLDLSSGGMTGLERPPKDLFVDVKVVKDCGMVWTERGVIDFRLGQRFLVRRGDVERLIVQGFLVEV